MRWGWPWSEMQCRGTLAALALFKIEGIELPHFNQKKGLAEMGQGDDNQIQRGGKRNSLSTVVTNARDKPVTPNVAEKGVYESCRASHALFYACAAWRQKPKSWLAVTPRHVHE